MNPHPAAPCVTVVPGTTSPHLAATGSDATLTLWLIAAAAIVVTAGIILLVCARRRHPLGTASIAAGLAVLLGLGIVTLDTPPSHAESASCSLIALSDLERGDTAATSNLLPGERVQVLRVTVRNVSGMPIHVRAALEPTTGASDAFIAALSTGASASVTGPLSSRPTTTAVVVAPGDQVATTVWVEVPDGAQPGASATFDTVFTATSD
ncbi:hypothetical protein [uncultured Microbacterium sp.]|uniref:hypothetical protein n=1 Tax=uncultured Microbacterium sp. TaxID=191216 RepID=UPI0025DFFCFC|nr:hypothetical protein [uncultured Microbacterium sp.]